MSFVRFYNLDLIQVSKETIEFEKIYPILVKNVDMSDLLPVPVKKKKTQLEEEKEYEDEKEEEDF